MSIALAPAADKSALPARDRILVTAHELFYGEGLRATGVDRLIAESGVTKVTFYRHFPSKNALVLAYLDYRHALWMSWFRDALRRHGAERAGVTALAPTLEEWFGSAQYRGCAFINAAAEIGTSNPQVLDLCRRHKEDMMETIMNLLKPKQRNPVLAEALAVAVDGAIVHAQMGMPRALVRASLERMVAALTAARR